MQGKYEANDYPSSFQMVPSGLWWLQWTFAAVAPAQWGDWGSWSKCTVCYRGKGLKARARTCYDPDSLSNEGCPGSPTQTTTCELEECTGNVIWNASFFKLQVQISIFIFSRQCRRPEKCRNGGGGQGQAGERGSEARENLWQEPCLKGRFSLSVVSNSNSWICFYRINLFCF